LTLGIVDVEGYLFGVFVLTLNLFVLSFPIITQKMIVTYNSGGCANAVKRLLTKMEGVSNVETDVEAKSVVVTADDSVSPQAMLEKLQKWSEASGKSVALAE